jgi:hypothetical protein
VIYRKENNFGGRVSFPQETSGSNSIQDRHRNIQNHNVGAQLSEGTQRCLAVIDRTNNLKVRCQQRPHSLERWLIAVHQQHSFFSHGAPPPSRNEYTHKIVMSRLSPRGFQALRGRGHSH